MSGIAIYEFDALVSARSGPTDVEGSHAIPASTFDWLEDRCLRAADKEGAAWLRLTQRRGRRAVQATSFVGVVRAPDGYQIEILPKVGKAIDGGVVAGRQLLIEMLCCLPGFRHVQTDSATLSAARMPLLEVFIAEFLRTVERIVRRGLRSDYISRQDNLFALRGKLLMAPHLRQNLHRADRFFTEHDEFSIDRAENRLLHAALRWTLTVTASQTSQQLARELCFAFADAPPSEHAALDFQRVRLGRGMGYYAASLAWARLILEEESPLTGAGGHDAPSLLFPMEVVFEAFVAKHLQRQLRPLILKTQARSHYLVRHEEQSWFRLKPDLLVRDADRNRLILDTKWKLLDATKTDATAKYGLSQADFYQLHAYGQAYLDGQGDVVLIYPKTDTFCEPLPVFNFPKSHGLRLWVLPFCLKSKTLLVPTQGPVADLLGRRSSSDAFLESQSAGSQAMVAVPEVYSDIGF